MILSKSCTYGIRALIFLALATERESVPVREISEKLDISFHFLTKVFQKLARNGIVKSVRGAHGGIRFSRKPEKITVMEIVLAIDGPTLFEECILGLPGCGLLKPCPLHDFWFEGLEDLKRSFNNTSLSALAQKAGAGYVRLTDVNDPDDP